MKEKAFRELHMELCWNIVKGGKKMDYINAFWVGGLICALAQILLDRTKMMPGRVMVSLVVLGCILGFVQIFKPLQEYAGAGVSVPLLGFGNTLWNGVKEAVDKEGFIGIFLGGFKASAAGISGALISLYTCTSSISFVCFVSISSTFITDDLSPLSSLSHHTFQYDLLPTPVITLPNTRINTAATAIIA